MLKRLMPKWLREYRVVAREALVDGWRYQRATGSRDRHAEHEALDRHEARLTMEYHRVEKGLSLPSPRRPFGRTVRPRLTDLLSRSFHHDKQPPYASWASDALVALDQWNDEGEVDDRVSPVLEAGPLPDRDEMATFFATRRSIRDFDSSRVPALEDLVGAVELARNTPSVCNRQGFRVHIYRDRQTIDRILQIQGGATGFNDTVPTVAVVTARRALFVGPMERNQRWVDGGLFAMTLVWALHAIGLGTCMLNWSMGLRSSDRLRAAADIPDGEDIVVLLAIGHPRSGARVARSEKRSISDLAHFHASPEIAAATTPADESL